MKRKIYITVLCLSILLISNFTTYFMSNQSSSRVNHKNKDDDDSVNFFRYKLRDNQFYNVLNIYNVKDKRLDQGTNKRKETLLPCIAKKVNGKTILVDISIDNEHRGSKYYSDVFDKYTIQVGDTLWFDGWISEECDDTSNKIYPVSVMCLYMQDTYSDWIQSWFIKKIYKK